MALRVLVAVVIVASATIAFLYKRSVADRSAAVTTAFDAKLDMSSPAELNASVADDKSASPEIGRPEIGRPEMAREELTEQFMGLYEAGKLSDAEKVLRRILLKQPDDGEAIFYLAKVNADQGRPELAIELLQSIPPRYSHLRLPTLGMTADLYLATDQFESALAIYSDITRQFPEARMAARQVAFLYNRMGRRHEANRLLKKLALQGDILQEELAALLIESDAMFLDSAQDVSVSKAGSHGTRTYLPIGAAGKARVLWTQAQYKEAAALLEVEVVAGRACAADLAFYGACLSEAQLDEKAAEWLRLATDEVKAFPEYWSALGNLCLGVQDLKAALGAYREAIARDPSDIRSVRRIRQCLTKLGDTDAAKAWAQRYDDLIALVERRTELTQNASTKPSFADGRAREDIAELLSKQERNIEAICWSWLATLSQPSSFERRQALDARRLRVIEANRGFPSVEDATLQLSATRFPPPDLIKLLDALPQTKHPAASSLESSIASSESILQQSDVRPADIRFRNVAAKAGADFRYRLETRERTRNFTIYQTLGGGVAMVDIDLDGKPDLYFPQADADGPAFNAASSDRLYRNCTSSDAFLTFVDVSRIAMMPDHDYSIGITAGDWNQDGFPDLLVSNIGPERLLTNQGDGTFVTTILDSNDGVQRVSTSVAIADCNGDHIPDLFVQNYVDDPAIMRRPPLGQSGFAKEPVNPYLYAPANDLIWIGSATGDFHQVSLGSKTDASTGLGLVITDLAASPGLEIYVANDERPNQLWHHDPQQRRFIDSAMLLGCALGHAGNAQGSMGIACGDLDDSATPDLFVTNFYNESNNVFMNAGNYFRDLNVLYEIDRSSTFMVGFGCQAVDLNHDGRLEIVTVNGHVEDLSQSGIAFQQRPQLLLREGQAYREFDGTKIGDYFAKPSLGRALARGDLDGDGLLDLVVTDLLEPAAILLNETESAGNWIGLKLVGTTCEREAIGAKAEVLCAGQTYHAWLTTGDGYLCKNDMTLHIGLGRSDRVDAIRIVWPDQTQSTYAGLKAGRVHCIVQGEQRPFELLPQ